MSDHSKSSSSVSLSSSTNRQISNNMASSSTTYDPQDSSMETLAHDLANVPPDLPFDLDLDYYHLEEHDEEDSDVLDQMTVTSSKLRTCTQAVIALHDKADADRSNLGRVSRIILPKVLLDAETEFDIHTAQMEALGLDKVNVPSAHVAILRIGRPTIQSSTSAGTVKDLQVLTRHGIYCSVQERSVCLAWTRIYAMPGRASEVLHLVGQLLGQAPIAEIQRPSHATWDPKNLRTDVPEGWSRDHLVMCTSLLLGHRRASAHPVTNAESKIQTRVTDRTGKPGHLKVPRPSHTGESDLILSLDPFVAFIRYAARQRDDLEPIKDDEWTTYSGSRSDSLDILINGCRRLIGLPPLKVNWNARTLVPEEQRLRMLLSGEQLHAAQDRIAYLVFGDIKMSPPAWLVRQVGKGNKIPIRVDPNNNLVLWWDFKQNKEISAPNCWKTGSPAAKVLAAVKAALPRGWPCLDGAFEVRS